MEKSAADFYRNRTNPDGLYNNCKECFASNSQRRQAALPPIEQRMASTKVRHMACDPCLLSNQQDLEPPALI